MEKATVEARGIFPPPPPCLGNPVFEGKELNVSGYWVGLPGHVGVYVCVSLLTPFPPLPSVHSVLGCLISCWRFGARGLRSPWEHFQQQEQKPDQERELSIGLQL